MAGKGCWRHGWDAVLAVALAVSVAAGSSGAAAAPDAAGRAAGPGPGAGVAAGTAGPLSAVPWRRVGAGWVLAEYWPGQFSYQGKPKAAAAALYLIDPAGGRYLLYRWAVTASPPYLADWSGDKSRALLVTGGRLEQVVLATAKVTRLRLAGQAQLIGYTRPSGRGLLGWRQDGSRFQLARYRLTGRLARVLATGARDYSAVYSAADSAAGTTLAVAGARGVQLVSNHGGVIRTLPVPGTRAASCVPSRWWNSGTILASCQPAGAGRGRLWLVPANGTKPAPLTSRNDRDPGDTGAWRLPGNLYLQAIRSSGSGRIYRQAPSGTVTPVTVPRATGSKTILAAQGARLLISARALCVSGGSLLWFVPSTRHELFLIRSPPGLDGVVGAVPYGQPTVPVYIAVGCKQGPP